MADIRINALATTAASTASDDFIAIDGSANGTRKLDAYSPTFGGNLTVSGYADLGSGGIGTPAAGHIQIGGSSSYGAAIIGRGSAYDFGLFNKNGDDVIHVATGTTNVAVSGNFTVSGGTITSGSGTLTLNSSANTVVLQSAGTTALTLDSSQNATFAGTGTSSFAGNLNIKGALGAHQTAALNLAYEGSSVSQLVAYGADASTLGRVNVILRKAGTGTDAVTGLSVRDFGIITQGGVAQTPASASATGAAGTIQWDASYIYICTATNTWKRVAIATW